MEFSTKTGKREEASWPLTLLLTAAWVFCSAPAGADFVVTRPYRGVTHICRTETSPRPAKVHIIVIDLRDPCIRLKLSPGRPPGPNGAGHETRVQTTLDFLNEQRAQIAINVHFFDFPAAGNGGTNLTGFAASSGRVYSTFEASPTLSYAIVPDAPALNIDAANRARIVRRGVTEATLIAGVAGAPYNTLSGSAQIITDGVKTIPQLPPEPNTNPPRQWYTEEVTARTAIGLSRDNATLFLLTVDAAGGSQGMTVDEMADFLRSEYGVYNALNLDGGGSTTLAMADPATGLSSIITAAAANPRAVGSSLAIFAAPAPQVGQAMPHHRCRRWHRVSHAGNRL